MAERGPRHEPGGAGTTAYPPSRASAASGPPDERAITRQPRATASRKQASVSAVDPEYDEAMTSVRGPQ
jgi:hypothetical protein